jgi:signal transduction histidine kinase
MRREIDRVRGGGVVRVTPIAAALALDAAAAAAAVSTRAAEPTLTLAGPRPAAVVLLLAVATALAAAGAAAWWRRSRSSTGPLLLCASATWSAAQLATPAAPSAALFTAGLALGAATPAAIALALVPDRRAGALLAVASAGLLGVLSALVFDPAANDCAGCPRNLLLVGGSEELFETLQRAGLWLGLAAMAWLLLTCARHPRLAAVTAYLLAVGVEYAHSLERGYLAADPTDRALWALQGIALLAVAATVAWDPVRERRARARLARLVVELEARPGPRGLRDVVGEVLGDSGLQIVYPLPDGRRVDAAGHAAAPAAGQAVTALRDAELFHRPGLLADPEVVAAIAESAGLALRNERLQAELRARLDELRAIRGRIVAAGDGERRALERDLHDGAQQRLATLAVSLEVARRRADGERAATLTQAQAEVRAALAALREVAHGLVPPVLADEGLGPAVEAFAETSDARVMIASPLTGERFAPEVEATAYHVLTEAVRRCGDATVHAVRENGRLRVSVAAAVPARAELIDLDDRVGALGGVLRVDGDRLVAEFPCA